MHELDVYSCTRVPGREGDEMIREEKMRKEKEDEIIEGYELGEEKKDDFYGRRG